MEKQDLINYQTKLQEAIKASPEGAVKRDLHLKAFADGKAQGPQLKELSITKPHLKYYTEEEIKEAMPECSIYEYIKDNNEDNLDKVALNYYDQKITYRELFENIDKAEKMFINNGVKAGDIVSMSLPTTPETVYMFYALNKIGAISNMIDPRVSAEQMHEYIDEVGSKLFVGIDLYDKKFKKALVGTTVEKTILTSAGASMPKGLVRGISNIVSVFKMEFYHKVKTVLYKNEIERAENIEAPKAPEGKADDVVVIVHTGGTTGKSKGVQLTNKNLNASSLQAEHTGYNLTSNDTWLNIMPPFIAYGVGNGLHLPLSVGMEVVLIPRFDPNKFADYIIKYRPNEMAGVPTHYENLIKDPKLQNFDLSFLKAPIVGGDSMNPELEKKTTQFLREHGCMSGVLKGYGMSEVSAAVSLPTTRQVDEIKNIADDQIRKEKLKLLEEEKQKLEEEKQRLESQIEVPLADKAQIQTELEKIQEQLDNKIVDVSQQELIDRMAELEAQEVHGESKIRNVGTPFSHTNIAVFKYELDENGREVVPEDNYYEELGANEVGQICIQSDNTMAGYYNNDEETDYVKRLHADGTYWIHSGDIGYRDKNGKVYVQDRMKRVIVRQDGFKIFPSVINDVIAANPAVKLCETIGVRDSEHVQGKLPKVFIVLNDEYIGKDEEVINELNSQCNQLLSEYYLPITFEVRNELPKTLIGKIDYRALEREEEEKNNRTR